jgi:transposase
LSRTEEYRTDVALLKTVPGIGSLGAMVLLTELYDISRFGSLDKLSSYVGLIPDTDSSGEKERQGGITKRRNVILRSLLIEAAWVAAAKDLALMMVFHRLCLRMRKTKAIVHIARKLLNRVRYVFKNQKPYVLAIV